nr:signal peptidase I [Stackebrandtia nassauensis]
MIDDEERVPPGAVADDAEDNDKKPASKTKKKGSFWRELPVLLVVAVVVALLVRTFVLQSFWIPSGSMENTLQLNDYVLANKLIYDFRDPERGEIVVFKAPQSWQGAPGEEDFIKRVIAVGGDTVSYSKKDKHIRVNGEPLDEESYLYTNPETGKQQSPSLEDQEFKVKVPEGRLWVMGDHRWASGDSRERWERTEDEMESTIAVDSVIGKAFVLIWPVNRWDGLTIPDTFDGVPEPK